ncbi:3-phosphoserine/phosphohydroxythreonine aminotransferase [Candidatus Marinamargulisbacteria bacterium SCGC AG-343-D04]|nr:3-phosphoserine/phosphohydroxythreonine aminotransferase [Candidatus Marinamargulisbacteria bacterium SCGC AG-343-D04]
MTKRIFNFSAGPATLPIEILERAQKDFLNYANEGMSVMEMSHRSKPFEEILHRAKSGVKELLNVPDTHDILFLQGGASLQFSMVPLNLKKEGKDALIINTGSWTKKAIKEIKKASSCKIIASSEDKNFSYIPTIPSLASEDASFAYLCSNNTIFGTQFKAFPDTGSIPLVADMSSDILSRPLDVSKFGLIFAGAQKNIGPSGVTLVIIRKDLAENPDPSLPSMLQYQSFIESNSLYNTIPTFGVYMIALMAEWLKEQGGLGKVQEKNEYKASLLYKEIEENSYYYCPVSETDRSLMNVVFRIHDSEDVEKRFVQEATEAGLSGLKGHRSVGGLRASIYNAHPVEGIEALVRFMKEFQHKYQK